MCKILAVPLPASLGRELLKVCNPRIEQNYWRKCFSSLKWLENEELANCEFIVCSFQDWGSSPCAKEAKGEFLENFCWVMDSWLTFTWEWKTLNEVGVLTRTAKCMQQWNLSEYLYLRGAIWILNACCFGLVKKFQVVEETGRGWKTPKNHLEIVWWLIRRG